MFNTVRIKRGQTLGAVYITRHGQAKTGARDHDDYDKLSTLGHQQAQWLGEFFAMHGNKFDRVYSGSLCRQQQTAKGINICGAEHIIDERLNEFTRGVQKLSSKDDYSMEEWRGRCAS